MALPLEGDRAVELELDERANWGEASKTLEEVDGPASLGEDDPASRGEDAPASLGEDDLPPFEFGAKEAEPRSTCETAGR